MPYVRGGASRRALLFVTLTTFVVVTLMIIFRAEDLEQPLNRISRVSSLSVLSALQKDDILTGPAIAPKLGNETAKAELGRAAWKLFHTTFARFPDKPSEEESQALKTYIQLFARLYPCGECASHFQSILVTYPPQVKSRSTVAAWGCHVHNEVNKSLQKELFDCSKIGDFYDCGCGNDDNENGDMTNTQPVDGQIPEEQIPEDEKTPVELEVVGLQRGGR